MHEPMMVACPLCGSQFQFGPQRYDGHTLRRYGGTRVCHVCWDGNWDGFAPHYEKKLLKILREQGLQEPERNDKGLLPRE